MNILNTLSIETPHGYREFRLVHGDLAEEMADLVIFSAHAGSGRPLGTALYALEYRHGSLELENAGLVLSLSGHSPFRLAPEPGFHDSPAGIYALNPRPGSPFKRLLMVRLPGARHFASEDAAVDAYRRAVQGTFAAVAALEFIGERYPTIALPVLGGARHFPKVEAVTTLLEAALSWLRISRHCLRIHFVVYEQAELDAWNSAMDQALGRTFAGDGDYSAASAELRSRLTDQIDALLAEESETGLRDLLHDLKAAMARPENELSIQHFGVLGRLTAEAMAARLCRDLGLTPGSNAFGNIERLEKSGSIAAWINSYLHSLRILGNESVHLTERDQRTPRTLAAGDLIVILSNLARVLDFYRLWQAQRTQGETKDAE
ncbi:hypothetical protein THIOKS1850026 [Thiocapsa sp. KS1]|nr:hypothetical protein [Thiocapsa sp. KS1]CRI67826.1 hypothetical protein THIOKS1850026 [Thiocapsa sp. KS1]